MIELHSRQDKGVLIHRTDHVMQFPTGEQHLVLNAPETEHPFLATPYLLGAHQEATQR